MFCVIIAGVHKSLPLFGVSYRSFLSRLISIIQFVHYLLSMGVFGGVNPQPYFSLMK